MSNFLEIWIIDFFEFIHFNRQFVMLLAYPALRSIKPLVGVLDKGLTKNSSKDQIQFALCFHTLLVKVLTHDKIKLIKQMRPLVNRLYFCQFASVDGTNLLYQIVKVFLHLSSSAVVYDVLVACELLFVLLNLLWVYLHSDITLRLFFAALRVNFPCQFSNIIIIILSIHFFIKFSNVYRQLVHDLCATHVCIIHVHVPEFAPI